MKTTSNRILVKVMKASEKKNGLGLTLPDPLNLQGLEKAVVVSPGDEIEDVKKDDTILIYKDSGTKFTDPEDGEEYRIISITDIVVIYE